MKSALLIGARGKLGPHIVTALAQRGVIPLTAGRSAGLPFDLGADDPARLPDVDAVIINGAQTSFRACEIDPIGTHAINADGPIRVARRYRDRQVVFVSSELAVCGLLAYGMQKRYAELGIVAVCNPVILRLSKIDVYETAGMWVADHVTAAPGIYTR